MEGRYEMGAVSGAGELNITFVEARRLHSVTMRTMSPFARVELGVGKQFNTAPARKGGTNPKWDQMATLQTDNARTGHMDICVYQPAAILRGRTLLGRFHTPLASCVA